MFPSIRSRKRRRNSRPMPTLSALQQEIERLRARNAQLEQSLLTAQNAQVQLALKSQKSLARRAQKLQDEAQALKRAALLQQVFFRMAERASAGLSMYDFLREIHQLLSELVHAPNCYVCLHDAQAQVNHFPYYVDERDGDTLQENNVPVRRGMTDYVLRSAQPQIIDQERLHALALSGEVVEGHGDMSFNSWLGVPMVIHGRVGGMVAVQDYSATVSYTEDDAAILSYVAHQLGSAIERYQALEALRRSEERYRKVIEKVGVGVVVVQDGRMVFANPALERIVGHPRAYLLSQPFTATVHPDDVQGMVSRHQRRLRGEAVEEHYGFRILTQAGEVRSLELSAVTLEWESRAATLMFVVDATARLQAEQAQREAVQHQAEMASLKARFVAMASHEFRTPLAAIHGSVELLQHYEERMSHAQKVSTLQQIDESVARMTHMLENVLLIGRHDAGQLEFRPAPLALGRFCKTLLDELRSAMAVEYERAHWLVELPPDHTEYVLDATLLRNMLSNLLSNALKYSPQGGQVHLQVHDLGATVRLSVRDQGIGIPQADQAQLFDGFQRASNVGSIPGTGLGLAIVKQAVQRHSGDITLHSEPGQGSCFTITLPLLPRSEKP